MGDRVPPVASPWSAGLNVRINLPSGRVMVPVKNSAFAFAMLIQSGLPNTAPASANARNANAFHDVTALSSVIGGTRRARSSYSFARASVILDVSSSVPMPCLRATASFVAATFRMLRPSKLPSRFTPQ